MPAWVSAGYEEYAKRLPREWALTLVELKPEPRDRGRAVPQLLAAEAVRLAAACAGATIVVLDERGSLWTTRQLADNLQQWREARADVAFVIGSADGLDAGFKRSRRRARRAVGDDAAARAGPGRACRTTLPCGEPSRRTPVSSRVDARSAEVNQ